MTSMPQELGKKLQWLTNGCLQALKLSRLSCSLGKMKGHMVTVNVDLSIEESYIRLMTNKHTLHGKHLSDDIFFSFTLLTSCNGWDFT